MPQIENLKAKYDSLWQNKMENYTEVESWQLNTTAQNTTQFNENATQIELISHRKREGNRKMELICS